ncbi:hypothetical protein GCM10010399_88700 [Dactylosporangium fulvum]|uniref:Bacterial Pleckstrin homology domain-containing protein n=1 Tax=Dactylosporangium fulvum TaxID=53359 RepID=A0ABY5VVX9_9ACTN|nr:hypothetical protein [Dactylosporangium fulvum]UWP80638.1 hypothetical protein Dfulv_36580 [Dactylosporangium fulvum]
MGERGRRGWLVLAVALPVGLPLLAQWQAAAAFSGLVVVVVGPVLAVQWWSRRRQRAAHARGVQRWIGHLPLERAVGLWDLGVGAAFLFGGGVPVRLTARPTGLTLAIRGPFGGPRHAPVTVQWSDIAGVQAGPAGRATEWGRVALLPLTTVTIRLVHGAAFVMTTHDAAGLVELIEARSG